jgi:hypothetical protein
LCLDVCLFSASVPVPAKILPYSAVQDCARR